MPAAGRGSSPLRNGAAATLTSNVCFGLTSFGKWELIQSGWAKQQVFFVRSCCCEARSSCQSSSQPCTVPQPMADADKDADQQSFDEIMEFGEDAEDALPLGDDDVQPVQGSRSSSSSSVFVIIMFG